MSKELNSLINELKGALEKIESGKTYTSSYVVDRFEKAADLHSTDQLICNMRDVLRKRANVQYAFTQSEIGNLYNHMLGFGGQSSKFRTILSDLLPESLQAPSDIIRKESALRTDSDTYIDLGKETELSKAFSQVLNLSSHEAKAKIADDSKVKKAVALQLQELDVTPHEIFVNENNEHFVLTTAVFITPTFKKISVHIPVEVKNSQPQFPQSFIEDGELVSLSESNLRAHLRQKEDDKNYDSRYKFSSLGDSALSLKTEVPKELKADIDDLEAKLLASKYYSAREVSSAISVVADELKRVGAVNPQVKVFDSSEKGLVLNASVQTPIGKVALHVPVEIHNGNPICPSSFSPANDSEVYDLNPQDFSRFLSSTDRIISAASFARDNGELKNMNYHQLVDRMLNGIANQDLGESEDALIMIQAKFGNDKFKQAFDNYSKILKTAASVSNDSSDIVKNAIATGELVKIPTTIEWYHPALKLPLSKIEVDEFGNFRPKGRATKLANQQQEAVETGIHKIKFS